MLPFPAFRVFHQPNPSISEDPCTDCGEVSQPTCFVTGFQDHGLSDCSPINGIFTFTGYIAEDGLCTWSWVKGPYSIAVYYTIATELWDYSVSFQGPPFTKSNTLYCAGGIVSGQALGNDGPAGCEDDFIIAFG